MPPKVHQGDASAKVPQDGGVHQGGKHPKGDHPAAAGGAVTAAPTDKPHKAPAAVGSDDGAATAAGAKHGKSGGQDRDAKHDKGGNQDRGATTTVSQPTPVPKGPGTTSLLRSPPAEAYVDGMTLGASIDAVTGEILGSAFDVTTLKPQKTSSSRKGDKFSFNSYNSYAELEKSSTFALTSSITFPADGLSADGSGGIDFSNNKTTSGQSIVYILEWHLNGDSKNVSPSAKLSNQAKQELAKGYSNFRNKYGDYYIYSISYHAKFTAVWKCTANSSSEINTFRASVAANVTTQSQLEGSAGFQMTLQSAAKENNVSLDVKYSTIGDIGKTKLDTNDPMSTLKSFQRACLPVPATVLLRHYSQVDTDIPATIDMSPSTYAALSEVFSQANYVLLLNGLAPGNATVRMQRRQELIDLLRSIHAARSMFATDPDALTTALSSLTVLRDKFLLLLKRQDLVAEQASLTSADIIHMFPTDHTDQSGTWVKAIAGHPEYVFGKFTFTPDEMTKYAIKTIESSDNNGMGCRLSSVFLFQDPNAAVVYPGASGCDGVAVGIKVKSNWTDGSNGCWCIPPENPLGKKTVKIPVKSEISRGMDWGIAVAYIATSDYDGSI